VGQEERREMSKKSTIECYIFCRGQENGKPVSLCSRCVQKLLIASPETIAEMKQEPEVTEAQLHFLNGLSDEEEEILNEHTTRKPRQGLDRARAGRAVKFAH